MSDTTPALVLVGLGLWLVACVIAWRVLLRRWGLSGAGAPDRSAITRDEYLARRSLRALLAFHAFIVVPIWLPLVIVLGVMGDFWGEAGVLLLGFVLLVLAVPHLRRNVRRLEAQRLGGLPPGPPLPPPPSGSPALDVHLGRPAPAMRGAVGVICAVSALAFVLPDEALLLRLAKNNQAILQGEVWRLLTVALVHGSLLHLLFNAWVLADVGRVLERLAGAPAFLLVLLLGTAAGSAASMALSERPSVGASGGVFAVVGALVAFGWVRRALFPPSVRGRLFKSVGELLVLNVALTFVLPRVDWAGHLGGLALGALLGLVLRPTEGTRLALAATPAEAASEVASEVPRGPGPVEPDGPPRPP